MTTSVDIELLEGEEEALSNASLQEFLAFVSDGLNFALSTKYVTEIITNYQITALPKVPSHIRGIINLRGQIIPVIDARIRMRQPPAEDRKDICIIIVSIDEISLGPLVDNVSLVLNIDNDQILPPPASNRQELVQGIVHIGGDSYLILDCEKLSQ